MAVKKISGKHFSNKMETKKHADPQEYFDYLKKIRGLADVTILNYISTYYRHFVKLDLDQKNIDRFIMSKNNNSVVRGFMKSYLDFLKLNKEFDLPKIKTGRKKQRIIRDLSKTEIQKVREVCYNNNVREGVLFDLLYYGALRRMEITTIKTNSFNWDDWFEDPDLMCEFKVTGKGKKERIVLVDPKAMKEILNIYLEREFINTHMEVWDIITKLKSVDDPLIKMGTWNIWNIIKKRSKQAIGRDVRPHEIRHCRATELLNNGASIRDIQLYLGHANMQTTEVYLHDKESASLKRIKNISNN